MNNAIEIHVTVREPLATFVSRRFLCCDTWTLYEDKLEYRSSSCGILNHNKQIPLSTLRPLSREYRNINRYFFPNLVGLIVVAGVGLLYWKLSPYKHYLNFSMWGIGYFLLYAVVVSVFACCPDKYVGFSGNPPTYLKYAWWQKGKATQFVQHVIKQIRERSENRT